MNHASSKNHRSIIAMLRAGAVLVLFASSACGGYALADEGAVSSSVATSTGPDLGAMAFVPPAPDGGAASSTTSSTASAAPPADPSSTIAISSSTLDIPSSTLDIPSSTLSIPSSTTSTLPDTGTGGSDDALIATGDAHAAVNITNVVNANITDSEGLISLLNLFEPYTGNIDLSDLASSSIACGNCATSTLQTSSFTENVNTSTVMNDVTVSATTGDNAAAGSGTSTIVTGNAAAAGNVVNVVNTNITDSNYLLLVLNDFSALAGDVILPGKEFFAQFLSPSTSGMTTSSSIENANVSEVSNNVGASASSGGNEATSSDGTATVVTGNANALANIVNMNNMNITTSGKVLLLIRVLGTWNGTVFSTPPGFLWQQTPDGIMLYGSGAESVLGGEDGSVSVANANAANVSNNVQVYALTGSNKIAGGGNAAISTGNASAAANVVNLVNTNVVGQNILFGLVNIMGDWTGNLAFGQPDLWVGVQATVGDSPLYPGSGISYAVTVMNRGDADATDVVLRAHDTMPNAAFVDDPGTAALDGNGDAVWHIPMLAAGDSMKFTYHESIDQSLPFVGNSVFTEAVSATEHEDDAVPSDNNDKISFAIVGPGTFAHISGLSLQESNSAASSTFAPGGTVHYRFLISDPYTVGPAQNVSLAEALYDPYGNIVSTSSWRIGTVQPGDRFAVTYDTVFPTSTPDGWYISSSSLSGIDSGGKIWKTKSIVSSSTVYVVSPGSAIQAAASSSPIVYVPPPSLPTSSAGTGGGTSTASVTIRNKVSGDHITIEKFATTSVTSSSASAYASVTIQAVSGPSSSDLFMASISTIFAQYPQWLLQAVKGWLPF